MSYTYYTVATKADIDKKIEIEAAHLMYLDFRNKEDVFKEARHYVETKYSSLINDLKRQGKY